MCKPTREFCLCFLPVFFACVFCQGICLHFLYLYLLLSFLLFLLLFIYYILIYYYLQYNHPFFFFFPPPADFIYIVTNNFSNNLISFLILLAIFFIYAFLYFFYSFIVSCQNVFIFTIIYSIKHFPPKINVFLYIPLPYSIIISP